MGLLIGEKLEPTKYTKTKHFQPILRRNAALQLTKNLNKFGGFENKKEQLNKFGTEVEFFLIRKAKIKDQPVYTVEINSKEYREKFINLQGKKIQLHPEFASYMVEVTPTEPQEEYFYPVGIYQHFRNVYCTLSKNTMCDTMFGLSVFPTMGKRTFYINQQNRVIDSINNSNKNKYSKSLTFLDSLITDHSRFKSFT